MRASQQPGTNPEVMRKQYETLDPQYKAQYEQFAAAVNSYQSAVM